jgi:uncharacterized hydantoinase/oxoprolinase family protein
MNHRVNFRELQRLLRIINTDLSVLPEDQLQELKSIVDSAAVKILFEHTFRESSQIQNKEVLLPV